MTGVDDEWLIRQCPGCSRSIAPNLYACASCWRVLPKAMRVAISKSWAFRRYSPGQYLDAHREAKAQADAWLARNRAGLP